MKRRAALVASDRVQLLLTLVPYLLERGEVSVAEAAEEFGVTPAQLRGMVEKLTVIGLPGSDEFWQMPHEMFDIDWDLLEERDRISITYAPALDRAPRLTSREAAALLAGLRLASTMPGVAESEVVQGLIAKLAAGASAAPADVVVVPPRVDEVRELVSRALRERVAVSFTYRAPDAPATTRTVDPAKVVISNGQWFLQGWCHLRRAMRTFNLERISDPRLTDTPAEHGNEAVPELFEPSADDEVAVIRFRSEIAPLVGEYLDRAEVEEAGGVSTARLRVADARSLKRLAARRGGAVEILEPAAARRATVEWTEAALALYGEG
ncbi:helix-turn-helix transcriptional regulator [Microbacterium sediminis]|uniref:WYL domain-containing protein n=1 Tax=Microbacterium sediminis TaxID=904291 RepID=A0A1B9N969_9MICO|nr:WYL domain-containing protein [Microbacterium sediminis]OCG73094.1 WYL domain-containing protein [Microbacterium sediminis]QBR74444.1 WYL domain-containing protein [Microbacterium sediminis]